MTVTADPWLLAANQLDPPAWHMPDRPPLRPHQQPPAGDWDLWIVKGGRGAGKTEAGSRYTARLMRANPYARGRIIGPTLGDVVESCVEDPESGLLAMDPDIRFVPSHPGGAALFWPNGSRMRLIGTPTPRDVERLRAAGNSHFDWWEEMAANPQLGAAWDQAAFGLRAGAHPHAIGTTTPRSVAKLRELLAAAGTVVTTGSIDDNPHLNDARRQMLKDYYAGTRLARQELYGELLDDIPGAIFLWQSIVRDVEPDRGELVKIAIGLDPSGGGGEDNAEMGIVVDGKHQDGRGYVLADLTMRGTPDEVCQAVWGAYDEYEADVLVVEKNHGGDWIPALLRAHRRHGGMIHTVTASRSKRTRAEPIAVQYEQGRWVHVKTADLAKLEDQMTSWVPDQVPPMPSPDRMDAHVWAATELRITGEPVARRPRNAAPVPDRQRPTRQFAGVRGRAW